MDRQILYPAQILPETSLLNMAKDSMIGVAKLAHAVLGDGPLLNSLACTPNSPAALNVLVGPGQIYSLQNIDGTAYSSLAADTTHTILKQGVSLNTVTLLTPAPGTAGQSINYLVQVAYLDTDSGATVLPYYNASNPAVAYSGPANAGTAQNTVRQGVCSITVKAGVSAATGSQTTPAADAGYTGAYVVTVANGATTVTAPNIVTATGAPFITETLTQKISQATGDARYAKLAGLATQLFSVANATSANHAVALGQFTSSRQPLTVGSASASTGTVSSSGWDKLPDGKIRQWISVQLEDAAVQTLTYPIAFPTAVTGIRMFNNSLLAGQGNPAPLAIGEYSSFTLTNAQVRSNNTSVANTKTWFYIEIEGY